MLHITFKYRDEYSNGKWNIQECNCESVQKAKEFYGLDNGDCEYEIISVEEV